MPTLLRVGFATLAALVLAAPAEASYSSARLSVVDTSKRVGPGGPVTLTLAQSAADEATARVVTYAPLGYNPAFAPPGGDTVGTTSATLVDAATGRVTTVAGALRSADPAPYRASAAACTGPDTALDGVFLVDAGPAGRSLPVYTRIIESGREAEFASGALTVCYPPVTRPGLEAPAGAKVVRLSITFHGAYLSAASAGSYRWRSLWTPESPAGKPDEAATVEAQALDFLPARLTLVTGRYDRRTRKLFVGGALRENERPIPGGSIQLRAGRTPRALRRLAVARTNANGNYGGRLALPVGTWYLRARATVRARNRNGCAVRTVPSYRCLRTTTAGFRLDSRAVRIVVPPR